MMTRPQQIDEVFFEVQRLTTCARFFLCGGSRIKSICRNRAMAAGLLREVLQMGTVEISETLNLKSHSSVCTMLKRCETDRELSAEVGRLSVNLRLKIWPEVYKSPDDG